MNVYCYLAPRIDSEKLNPKGHFTAADHEVKWPTMAFTIYSSHQTIQLRQFSRQYILGFSLWAYKDPSESSADIS